MKNINTNQLRAVLDKLPHPDEIQGNYYYMVVSSRLDELNLQDSFSWEYAKEVDLNRLTFEKVKYCNKNMSWFEWHLVGDFQ